MFWTLKTAMVAATTAMTSALQSSYASTTPVHQTLLVLARQSSGVNAALRRWMAGDWMAGQQLERLALSASDMPPVPTAPPTAD